MEEPEDGSPMGNGDWETIKELVFQCEDEQPPDLDAWLTERCPTAAIRQETERLVRAAALSGDFMRGRAVEEHFGIAPQHPVHIGRYRIIEELGVGGLGVVYAAYDHALERKVAIKALLQESAEEPESRKRLQWDAKAACAIAHPNIVAIYDFGTDAGRDYIVMECIEGQSLGKLIPKEGLPCQTVLRYARQIASGLEAAHRGGIVHRDLKPNNIMVTGEGVVKLLDFGLARNYDPNAEYSSLPATIEGHFAGTVAYVSPEQAEGKPVDARGDIFSFGCILFEMLTGNQAFQGRNAVSILGNIVHRPAPSLRQVAPQLDERFAAIVERCMAKDPDDRFPTIAEVQARLGELAEADKPPSRVSQLARKRLIRWGVGAGIAAMVALGVMWIATRQPFPGTQRFYAAQLTPGEGLSSFPAISPDGGTVAYASDRAGNGDLDIWMQYWGLADAQRLTSNPANETSPVFYPRGDRLLYRSEQDGAGLYSISTLGGSGTLLVRGGRDGRFSADGRWLAYWKGDFGGAFHREQSRIYVMPARGGEQKVFLPGFDAAAHPVWAATGNYLIFLGREGPHDEPDWWVASYDTGVVHPTGLLKKFLKMGIAHPFQTYFVTPAQWLPHMTVLFSANSSKMTDVTNIWAVRVGTDGSVLDEPRQWTGGTGIEDYPSVVSASDGAFRTVFATLTATTAIWRIPLSPDGRTGGISERLMSGFPGAGSPSLSADGRKLLFSARQPSGLNTRLADLGSLTPTIPPVVENAHAAYQPVLSGDGSTIAWESGTAGLVMAVQGAAPEVICRPCGPPTHLTFDGRAVLFEESGDAGTSGGLLLVVRGQKPRALFHTPDGPPWRQSSGRFSPNQHWVAFSGWHDGSAAKQILVVPVTADGLVTAGQIVEITNDEFINREPTWSPDGLRIYFLSNRDGFGCVWARDVDPATARPLGAAFPVAHFHSAGKTIHGPSPYPGSIGLSAARDFLVLTLTETSGTIWERSTTPLL
jgi:Tol biopolymer transport system component/predicted Ser/Thr protein kinase